MVINVGKECYDFLHAAIENEAVQSKDSREKLDAITNRICEGLKKSHVENSKKFIKLYGQEIYDFIDSAVKGRSWLISGHDKLIHVAMWDAEEQDDHYEIIFIKGKFYYRIAYCGGYAGFRTLKSGLTIEEVKELIKQHQK